MHEVKKGKTKGIFDMRQETNLEKMLFKNGDQDIKEMLDKQLKDSDSDSSELSINMADEIPLKKKTLDEANKEIIESQAALNLAEGESENQLVVERPKRDHQKNEL